MKRPARRCNSGSSTISATARPAGRVAAHLGAASGRYGAAAAAAVRAFAILAALCPLLVAWLAGPAPAESLDRLIERHGFAAADVGVVVETLAGERLVAHRADLPGLPASTIKLATALGALDRLGPDHRFETRVWRHGELAADGQLAGDIVLEGGGDPLFDLDGLMTLVLALRRAGVRQVAGRLLVDDGAMPLVPMIDQSQPHEAPYNAGVGALSLAFNRVERQPLPSGGFLILPPLLERGPAWARAPATAPASIPVRDPGMHTAEVFRTLSASLGIDLPSPERGRTPQGAVLLAELESRPLRDLVQAMLLYSNNQVAETIGLASSGELSLAASARVLAAPIIAAAPEVDWRGFAMTNHSGLDAAARATPDQLLAILRLAEERHDILSLLPVAAWSGSLASRFRHPDTALRIWAKTGSLDFATALVGYALPVSGEPRRLAVLIADDAQRRWRDGVATPTGPMRQAIEDFTRRARDLRDALALLALSTD